MSDYTTKRAKNSIACKKYREANRQKIRNISKAWYDKNKEYKKQKNKEYYDSKKALNLTLASDLNKQQQV